MGIFCTVILPAPSVVSPHNTQFTQRGAVGSEFVGHDGRWSDALLFQEFSHQLEGRLAVSTRLNEDIQNSPSLSTARQTYSCLPLMETNTSSRCHRPAGRGRPRLDATVGEHIFDVAVAQSEAEIKPDGLLDHDAGKAVAAV